MLFGFAREAAITSLIDSNGDAAEATNTRGLMVTRLIAARSRKVSNGSLRLSEALMASDSFASTIV